MTSKLTRERLQEIAEDGFLKHGESKDLARMALAAMDSESECLPLDYLQGHKDGLEWAAQLAEANHPETGDWLYEDPIELAKAIRKGPDMPPSQPAPVVIDDIKLRELFDSWFASDCSFDLSSEASEEDNIAWRESYWYVWQRCRAAMLQELQKSAGASNNCRSNENVQAVPGESRCSTKAAPPLDSLPKNTESRCSNSPVIPDGYVMVPKEPTKEMIDAGWLHFMGTKNPSSKGTYKAMLAAAPQEDKK